jgi:hypothetical protein
MDSLPDNWRSTPGFGGWVPPADAVVRIVCAANLATDGTIYAGARHGDAVMRSQAAAAGNPRGLIGTRQGFIDQFGRFWNRLQAKEICLLEGQDINWERNGGTSVLYSEGLY